ncbi:MAG: exodeoxyribonuclease VII small subunit [Tidjanibacter sp.]|nr:exodeoxyribonuclease VII small subunit [Tidjanibacter sp.]MBQ6604751.1 exodeoxyribonuclease VII small subunit [Tidjanibacter sp.]
MAEKMSYGESVQELEAILSRLRGVDVDIDSLAVDVKRATELIAYCRQRLAGVEDEVGRILQKEE